jgi:hypothetical protein
LPTSLYEFKDAFIRECVEHYFRKSADELTEDDLLHLSELQTFVLDRYDYENFNYITTLEDLPVLFPKLRHIRLASYMFDSELSPTMDISFLEELESLRAVEIFADGLPSLDFVNNYPYVALFYSDDAFLKGYNNLAEASVLGREFIEDRITGQIFEVVRVVDGERIYELFVSDKIIGKPAEIWEDQYIETVVFISEYKDGEYHFIESLDVPWRVGNIAGGLIITDADFDGQKDILVVQGHFGAQGIVTFTCLLSNKKTYKISESFSTISNPALDRQNKRVLSTWRNHSASHSWAMFSVVDGEFVETERLTEEPEVWGEYVEEKFGCEVLVWRMEDTRFYNGNAEIETYLSSDYTDVEWLAMFYNEESFWGLLSSKWLTLSGQTSRFQGDFCSEGIDGQIMEIITADISG